MFNIFIIGKYKEIKFKLHDIIMFKYIVKLYDVTFGQSSYMNSEGY